MNSADDLARSRPIGSPKLSDDPKVMACCVGRSALVGTLRSGRPQWTKSKELGEPRVSGYTMIIDDNIYIYVNILQIYITNIYILYNNIIYYIYILYDSHIYIYIIANINIIYNGIRHINIILTG